MDLSTAVLATLTRLSWSASWQCPENDSVAAFQQHTQTNFNLEVRRSVALSNYMQRNLRAVETYQGIGMHRFAVVGAGLLSIGLVGAASAADLAVKTIPAAPVPFTWSGCFVGGHLGGVESQDTRGALNFSSTGFVGGGQIGCDYQLASNWVLGVEGRAAWTSMGGSHPGTVISFVTGLTAPSQFTLRNDFLASATARLGYSFAPRWLVFARGGGAWTREKIDDAFTSTVTGLAVDPGVTRSRTGWTAGTGVEWAFAPHWSASVEYNYYNFGSGSVLLTGPTSTVIVNNLKDTIHAVTTGLNYRF